MIGSIIGDVIGSPYEGRRMNFFDYDFPLFNERSTFTDDTILTVATAKAILEIFLTKMFILSLVESINVRVMVELLKHGYVLMILNLMIVGEMVLL